MEGAEALTSSICHVQVYFDMNVAGESQGRIVVQLFDDVPIGSRRFMDLAEGHEGISYQLSKVDTIAPTFIRVSELPRLSYSANDTATITGGDTVEQLEVELQDARHAHGEQGLVSLVVKDSRPRPVKERLVAYQGKLVTVQEQQGAVPNGSGFVITTAAAPELDTTNLVVGRVIGGMDVVEAIAQLPSVKANTGSPFFKVAKIAGDKRADVAEKGFGRPFKRVVIAQSGVV
ncbi:cyclophilin-like protein [Coccomyxa subellipsoidea C-169]|uniref:Cyclophilin-like protein n=1 Tax=Coccomyxa subellipsoidea (strain C-169) TaxID=574566 RepID=I0Z1G7_COCSC|nr:cyclophilin-like protein [Coccomyxa subellipsoidea C-169]EIE24486.1 cyclophilin-like protein [Coccomyxa subellipsoidea C-169]|eukprot:XP_005649030.1 cyclophilin-like protein [Coccomyxa subellipsoidea C-169]